MRPLVTLLALCVFAASARASDPPALVTSWGGTGTGPGQLDFPRDVAVAPGGNVYVVDVHNSRVQYFTPSGSYLGEWGGSGSGPGQFQDPRKIAIDDDGNVYVSDGASRVQKFTATGGYLMSFVDPHIASPLGVAVDSDGNLYVGSLPYVSKFDDAGQFLTQFTAHYSRGSSIERDADGSILVGNSDYLQRFSFEGALVAERPGSAIPEYGGRGVAADRMGNALLVFTNLGAPDEIYVYSHDLSRQRDHWLPPRLQGWAVPVIQDLAATSDGFLYLADAANNRIMKVEYSAPVPAWPTTWGGLKAKYR